MSAPVGSKLPRGWYGAGAQQGSGSTEETRRMADSAWTIVSRLISGLVLYTAVGWLLSVWIGHQAVLMAIGAGFGLLLSYYLIFKSLRRDEEPLDAQAIHVQRVKRHYR